MQKFDTTSPLVVARFREERAQAGLENATTEQLKRARNLADSNPLMRHRASSAMGLELLALNMPLTRRERQARRKEFGAMVPRVVRHGDETEIATPLDQVQAFIDANPGLTGAEAAEAIAGMYGYTSESAVRQVVNRVRRYGESFRTGKRFPSHIRGKMLMVTAIATAIQLCDARQAAVA